MAPYRSLILLLAILLLGCRPATPTPEATPVTGATLTPDPAAETSRPLTQTPTAGGVTPEQVQNSLYELGAASSPRQVQLVDGLYQEGAAGGEDFLLVRMTEHIALGDLDGDGVNEAAAVVTENYGGSGVFMFLAVYAEQDDQAVYQTSTFIDDRARIQGLEIENEEVWLLATVHRFDEAMCCPTLETERHYRWFNNQLDMSDYATFTPDGRPRTIRIESPANGTEVSGSFQVKGSVAIAPFENNLIYSMKDVGNVEISRGAVTVTAEELGAPGTFDVTIPMSDTLWPGAVIVLEIQDVSVADGTLMAMDSVRLVVK